MAKSTGVKAVGAIVVGAVFLIAAAAFLWIRSNRDTEESHRNHEETPVTISNPRHFALRLYKAGRTLAEATELPGPNVSPVWLRQGRYFLEASVAGRPLLYPLPVVGFRMGPDGDGGPSVTVRQPPPEAPPPPRPDSPGFAFIPSGHFLMGDRRNPQDPHYVWLPGYFVGVFEVTNAEYLDFINAEDGYRDDANWTPPGKAWKSTNPSRASALLRSADAEFKKFGKPDDPVVLVNWYESNAYCRWVTRRFGNGKWQYSLPSEAEWEKAARGPDSFDYALGTELSDAEVSLYNWRKNPGAEETVVGYAKSLRSYSPSRYGLYHMTGNAAEWTQSEYRALNRLHPYQEDDRNHDDAFGLRVVRGGSWYTASIGPLSNAYRENFQPEVAAPYLGFRIVVRYLS